MTDMSVTAARVFDLAAEGYDAMRRCLVPCFDDFYGTAVRQITDHIPAHGKVLDLGAGTGMLSAILLKSRPDAEITLLDASSNMLAKAEEKLKGKIKGVIESDMVKADLMANGPWDAVISSLAIHHLEDEDKVDLFRRIRAALKPGGIFVNAEQVSGSSEALTEQYRKNWIADCLAAGAPQAEVDAALARQAEADCCATTEHQVDWMRLVGFRDPDCVYKNGRFTVFAARV